MESDPASVAEHKHTNRWMTMLALGLLAICLLACLYILIGFPAEAQTVGGSTIEPATTQVPAAPVPYQPRRPIASYAAQAAAPAAVQSAPAAVHNDATSEEIHSEINQVHDQLRQSQDTVQQAMQAQRRVRTASALFLAVFAIIAALIVIQVYQQARAWDKDASHAVAEVEAVSTELKTLRDARSEARSSLPGLLQEVGEQPLSFQEEGNAFSPRAQAIIDDIDNLAYVGQGRIAFQDLSSGSEAAVYLNGLLLSAVAHLYRSDPWTALSRLDQFFSQMTRFPDAVERRRIAQAYSYRALAGYMVLEAQDREPSWQRKTERVQLESLSKQAFADIAHAASVDPEWRHTTLMSKPCYAADFMFPRKLPTTARAATSLSVACAAQ